MLPHILLMAMFDWSVRRRHLEMVYHMNGITQCELQLPGCTFGLNARFAHSKKVREWETQEDVDEVIVACTNCHAIIEALGKRKVITMEEIVKRTRARRIVKI